MKRIISLSLMLIFGFALCACANDGAKGGEQCINPVHECTVEELAEKTGLSFNSAYDGARYCYIDGEPVIAQMEWSADGIEYCLRAAKTDERTDISGTYYDWVDDGTATLDIHPGDPKCQYDAEGHGIVTWYLDGVSYSISVDSGASREVLMGAYFVEIGAAAPNM